MFCNEDCIMIYIENIISKLPREAVFLATILIEDIKYILNINGKLGITMRTNSPIYETFVKQLALEHITKIEYIDILDIRSNDVFDIYYLKDLNHIEEFWSLRTRSSLEPAGISTISEPVACPVCHKNLVYEEDGLYCFNSVCPAKVKMTIRKFLYFVSNGTIIYSDYKFLDQLVFRNLLRTPLDLYQLTVDDLLSLGCKPNMANDIIHFIQDTIGKVTISQYLKSLNINIDDFQSFNVTTQDRLQLSENTIDRSFKSIYEFLDWWKFIYNTPGQSPEPYMNDASFMALSNFLGYDENISIMTKLDQMGLFKYF